MENLESSFCETWTRVSRSQMVQGLGLGLIRGFRLRLGLSARVGSVCCIFFDGLVFLVRVLWPVPKNLLHILLANQDLITLGYIEVISRKPTTYGSRPETQSPNSTP